MLLHRTKTCDWRRSHWDPVHTYPEIFVSSNLFRPIQKYLRPHIAYTNRMRPSTRIRFGHLKGLVNRARAEKDLFWYCDVCVYKNIRIRASTRIQIHSAYRNFHSGERIQKSPDTPSVYGGHVWTLGVSALKNLWIQKSPDTCGRGLTLSSPQVEKK